MMKSAKGKSGNKPNQEYKPTKKCPYPSKGLFRKNGKLYQRVVENYMIRDVLIPERGGNIQKTYFCTEDYDRINAFVNEVKEDSEEMFIRIKKEQNKAIEASSNRVDELRKLDMEKAAAKSETRGDLQEQDDAKVDYSLKRAKELLMNQKDEMKMCNKYIMEAKCQEIRKDQLAEQELRKEEEKRQLKQENDVLVQKMLDEAVVYEKEKALVIKKKKLYVEGINSQIKENQIRRQIEQEQIAEEGRLNRESSCQEMLNAVEERNKKKREQQENVRKLNDYNKNVIRYMKAVENEENLTEERKIKEYHEEKERKEKELLAEKTRLKKEKEKVIGEMMDRQMKSMADEELREAIHTQYVQDLVERKWRQKEKEAMEKKLMQKKEMMEGREKQKQRKNELIAAETIAEKEDFYARMKVVEEQREKEQQEEIKKRTAANKHRIELLNQVYDKEVNVIEERKQKFMEAKSMNAARDGETKEIRDHIERKINALAEYNLPPSCQREIRRKLMKQKILV